MGLNLLEVGFVLVDNSSGILFVIFYENYCTRDLLPLYREVWIVLNPYYRHIFMAENTIAGTCEAPSKQRSTAISFTIKHHSLFKCKTAAEVHHFKDLGNRKPVKTGYTAIPWPLYNIAKGFKITFEISKVWPKIHFVFSNNITEVW